VITITQTAVSLWLWMEVYWLLDISCSKRTRA